MAPTETKQEYKGNFGGLSAEIARTFKAFEQRQNDGNAKCKATPPQSPELHGEHLLFRCLDGFDNWAVCIVLFVLGRAFSVLFDVNNK